VKSQCLPFRQIPHSSKLFTDFLSWSPQVRQFFPRSPHISQWLKDEKQTLRYEPARREQVSAVLRRQNNAWDASPGTIKNIDRLRGGASAVVTGQQVGLFGGPLFAIFKALSAIKLADEATAAGVECVPVFWLATTDHDLAEVNHVAIPGPDGLRRLTVATAGIPDAPVHDVIFGPEIAPVVQAAAELVGDSEAANLLGQAYQPGENLGSAFARLFAALFAAWGVVLLDASDPEIHRLAEPIYRSAVERAPELNEALLTRGQELESAGYHQQVKVTPSSTLLFMLRAGARVPVHQLPNRSAGPGFLAGEEKIAGQDLFERVRSAPQDFSPNVLLRPIVEDYLLPTLAYVGGAAETAYFAQAGAVYQALLGRTTPVIPRFSATLIEPKLQSLLERYELAVPDLFPGADAVREELAQRALPQELQSAFNQADSELKTSMANIQSALSRLDRTLIDAARNAAAKMQHQLDQLRSRAARAELRQTEVLSRHADLLSSALYPNKTLQEREIGGIYFLARHGTQLLHNLYQLTHTDCLDHQLISL
jgi:bacillithiol biosynthesis cysteine-adding enzyme BshC